MEILKSDAELTFENEEFWNGLKESHSLLK